MATVLGFLLALDRWAVQPSRGRAAVVGAALALASLCKLTAPLLCAVLAVAWLAGRRMASGRWLGEGGAPPRVRALLAQAALAAAALLVVVWAGYRFSVGRLDDLPPMAYMGRPSCRRPASAARCCRGWRACGCPPPNSGTASCSCARTTPTATSPSCSAQTREHGFRNFYLVGLALKSPPPFSMLLLAVAAGVRPLRPPRRRRPRAAARRWRPSRRWRSRRS